MNATFGNDRKLRQRIGPASVALHPREAAGRGLRNGDPVTLRNATGALADGRRDQRCRAAGRRLRAEGPLAVARARRVPTSMRSTPGDKTDMGESSAVHGVLVELVPG